MDGTLIMLTDNSSGEPDSPRNRRKSKREKPAGDDVVTIYRGGDRWPAIIVDESNGGFGLAVPATANLKVGDSVRVTAHRNLTKAKVVSLEVKPGGIRLGLEAEN